MGSVFFPLRSCSSSSIKKKSDPVGFLDDGVAMDITRYGPGTDASKNGSSDAIGSKRKIREEQIVIGDDGIGLLGFKDVKASKKVANESLSKLEFCSGILTLIGILREKVLFFLHFPLVIAIF